MSKKKLLSEATVRQFMKYANIGHLTENFIDEGDMYEEEEELDIGPEDAPVPPLGDEDPVGDLGDEDPVGDEAPSEELPPEAVEALEGAVEKAVEAMLAELEPYGVDEEEIVNETLRRVTSRIKSMQKRDRLAESVANRIMKRLSKNK